MRKEKQLYCCSSYYQLYISLLKVLTQEQTADLVLEEHGMETAASLAENLKRQMGERISRVFVCPDSRKTDPYTQRSALGIPWQRREILAHMDRVFAGTDIGSEYGQIHVFWDLGYAGTYCNIRRIHYTLHEDSLNSYQHIRENRSSYRYIFNQKGLKFLLKKRLRTGVIPFGYSDCCDVVEVNEIRGIQIPADKVREVPRAELEERLDPAQKKAIFEVFAADLAGMAPKKDVTLLLTEPFAVTGRVADEDTQVRLYRDVIETYAAQDQILIKPHPRDTLDYRRFFPDAAVMEKNIPMEILNFNPDFWFARAVTVTSSAIFGIRCVGEKLSLGHDFLRRYQ